MLFEWDDGNTRHISHHKVTREEAEQILRSDTILRGFEVVGGEERWASLGHTGRGRILLVWWTVRRVPRKTR